ncbi:MAG: ERF family protein [Prevotella sp.]
MSIYKAMAGVMAEVDAIGKDKTNSQQGFKYRGIDQVYNSLNPLLAKHKIFTLPKVIKSEREERTNAKGTTLFYSRIEMEYSFVYEDGSSVSCSVIGEGMDSGDKATNKAMAIAHKYALLQTFCIPTEDMPDPDAEVHEVKPKQQPKPQQSNAKVLFKKLKDHYKCTDEEVKGMLHYLNITSSDTQKVDQALKDFGSIVLAIDENMIGGR